VPALEFSLILSRMVLSPVRLDAVAAFADVGQHSVNALLVDDTQAMAGHTHAYPAILALDPEAALMQIRIENSFSLVVSVRNVIAYNTSLACYLAFS
jgi:hypothetical protein